LVKVNFKYDEIKDYVDTMLDYLNNALGDDISIEFKTDTIYEIYRKEHYLTKMMNHMLIHKYT
jgi:hypothetical protein